uniref:Outer membrane protein beta-barrel domain-containing protein n=1 Tax=Solibacter usitatus (strain Ellin6076) TaxID=234267 RepID=Q01YU9_SOLUE
MNTPCLSNNRSLFSCLLLAVSCAGISHAQYTRGYVFVAPTAQILAGKTSSAYAAGGGMERILRRGFGAGVELSGILPGTGKANQSVGLASFNGYYHPVLNSAWDPYLTAGYSCWFSDFVANGANFGSGLNYWYNDNRALMVEFRDSTAVKPGIFTRRHDLQIRIGLTFR